MPQYNVFGKTWLDEEEWLGKWKWDEIVTVDVLSRFQEKIREVYRNKDYASFKVEKAEYFTAFEFPARVLPANCSIDNSYSMDYKTLSVDLKEFDVNTMRIDPDMQILLIRKK